MLKRSSLPHLLTFALLAGTFVGCGDPPLAPTPDTSADADGSSVDTTFSGADVGSSSTDTNPDAAATPIDDTRQAGSHDAGLLVDSGTSAADTTPAQDVPWTPPDVDLSSLQVIAADPPHGSLGAPRKFVFTLTFSAAVVDAGIQPYTVLVNDAAGMPIDGDFSVAGAKVTFKASKATYPLSRVDVVVTTIVQGVDGQTMQAPHKYHFHTEGYAKTAPWADLARRHAPVLLVDVHGSASDWPADEALQLDPAQSFPTVGYNVTATRSHWFIHYLFRRPKRPKSPGSAAFSPDLAGALVVVAAQPEETPVGLFTWFKQGNDEQWWGWLTSDGGLLPPGYNAKKANVRAVLPGADLFPPSADAVGVVPGKSQSPRRYTGLLTAKTQQSCLWSDLGEVTSAQCQTHQQAKMAMKLLRLVPWATTGKPPFAPQPPDAKLTEVHYALSPADELLWPRRSDGGLFGAPLTFTYKPPAGRPAGLKVPLGSKFASTATDFARPPWAWRWKPSTNVTYYDMPRGTLFMDPAYAVHARLGGDAAKLPKYDPAKKTGYSLDYCFSPQLFIDQRADAACAHMIPPAP